MKINRTKIGKWKTGMVVLTILKGKVINLNFDNNASTDLRTTTNGKLLAVGL